jgi:hypothetical protein
VQGMAEPQAVQGVADRLRPSATLTILRTVLTTGSSGEAFSMRSIIVSGAVVVGMSLLRLA